MTPFLPQVKAKDVIRVAEKLGFKLDRQSGSHAVLYRESDKRRVVVPVHKGKDIKPKTLHGIIKDMGIEPGEFKKLL
jgi:predicted RNA binding protein YcfA (HicA-like mRNA interferase family)